MNATINSLREMIKLDYERLGRHYNKDSICGFLGIRMVALDAILDMHKMASENSSQEIEDLKQAVRDLVGQIDSINKKENTPDYRETVVVKRVMQEGK